MRIHTFKQYLGECSGSLEVDICLDKILYVHDHRSGRNKAKIYLDNDKGIEVANTRAEIRAIIENKGQDHDQ